MGHACGDMSCMQQSAGVEKDRVFKGVYCACEDIACVLLRRVTNLSLNPQPFAIVLITECHDSRPSRPVL